MLLDIVQKGATDRSVILRIIDSTDGTPETGVVYNTSGIDLWYRREGAAVVSITEATLAALTTAHADGGFLHVSHGYYRLDLPDAAFASGANYVDVGGTVTGMVVIGGRVRLVDVNLEDAVRAGLTALPNAAAEAAGGLYTRGSGAGQIVQPTNGRISVDTVALSGDATAADNAESFFDGTGYAGTNNTIPTVTTLTNAPGDSSGVTTLLSRLTSTRAGYLDNLSAGAVALASSLTSLAGDVTSILGKFSGITLLAQWLGLIAGKQVGNSTARTELRATGAGSGTFDETTDSIEAVRDRGDAAWTTAAGFSTLDAAGVRTAVGLASANLDTQLSTIDTVVDRIEVDTQDLQTQVGSRASQASVDDLPTNAELATALAGADDAVLAAIGALHNLSAAAVNAEVDQALTDAALATAAALSTAQSAITLIKAKTDSLTFTQTGHVDANVQRINDVAIVGDGDGTPFGVA